MKRKSTYAPSRSGAATKRPRKTYTGQAAGAAYRREVARRAAALPRRSGELKGLDTILTQAAPIVNTTSTNGNSTVLNLVQPGTGSWNRVGRKIYPKSLRLKGSVLYQYAGAATTANLADNWLRMVVVYDKQPSGAAIPTFETIFGTTDQNGSEAGGLLAALRYDNMDRFKVLLDKCFDFGIDSTPLTTGSVNSVSQRITFDEYLKLKVGETVYSGQSSPQTIADISSGALYVYWRCPLATAGVAEASVESSSFARLRYTD